MYRNNIKSVWKCEDMKVIFSEPSIQAWESIVHVKDIKDILYYYYGMDVYRKKKKKWKKELSASIWDFPQILVLDDVYKKLNENNFTDGTWQVDKNEEYTWYAKSYTLGEFAPEDFYKVEKSVRVHDEKQHESFCLTIGSGMEDGYPNQNDSIRSVVFSSLSREEMDSFMDTVREFIQKSIIHHNTGQDERINAERKTRKVKNGKMYEYKNVYGDDTITVDYDIVDDIYAVGDKIHLTLLERHDGESVFVDYEDCQIVDIEESRIGMDGYLTITCGCKTFRHTTENLNGKMIKIPVELIMHSAIDMDGEDKKKLSYNEEQCMEEFEKIMSKEERKEFATTSVDDLVKKWTYAVACRTWMFRDEHGFKNPRKTIKRVIKKIKKKCEMEANK